MTHFAVDLQNTEFSRVQSFVNTSSVITANNWQSSLCCGTMKFILREHLFTAYILYACIRHILLLGDNSPNNFVQWGIAM